MGGTYVVHGSDDDDDNDDQSYYRTLLNDATFDDLEWPLTRKRIAHFAVLGLLLFNCDVGSVELLMWNGFKHCCKTICDGCCNENRSQRRQPAGRHVCQRSSATRQHSPPYCRDGAVRRSTLRHLQNHAGTSQPVASIIWSICHFRRVIHEI